MPVCVLPLQKLPMFFHVPDKDEPLNDVSPTLAVINILTPPEVRYIKLDPAIVPLGDTPEVELFQATV